MRKIMCIVLTLVFAVFLSNVSIAAEHPGAVKKDSSSEHPGKAAEHPGEGTVLSAGQIIKGIKNHIKKVTEVNEGYFPAYDSKEGKGLGLKLINVHEDRVSFIKKENAYFACTDFKTADGKTTYDIDFWMRKGKGGELEVYRTKIHKKDGVPRFSYRDDEIVTVE